MLRRLLIAAVLMAGFGAFAAPHARAATIPCHDPQPQVLSSTHFVVTYTDTAGSADAITEPQAQTVLSTAEQAYDAFVAMGFAAPPWGIQIEINVLSLTSQDVNAVYCAGEFDYDSGTVATTDFERSLYGEVFTQFIYGQGVGDDWLVQGLSNWAALKSLGFPSGYTDYGPWEVSLDCTPTYDPTTNNQNETCTKDDGYANVGDSRWPFYEYLAEKYGSPGFINEVLADAASTDGLTGIETALAAHGSSLATEYGNFAAKLLTGGWAVPDLNAALPTPSATIETGAATGDTSPQSVRVGHLGTRFVEIDRGDGDPSHKCYTATLTITVNLPSGVSSQPVFFWPGTTAVPLAVSGSTATATLPWDTCTWSTSGYLSLPNESTTVDNAYFTVSTHLAVTTTETTAAPPTAPANGYGNATDVNSALGAPVVSLLGPSTLKLGASDTSLDLVVESSDQGLVEVQLGSLKLGTTTVVPGENALHFTIPASAAGTLTVTPTSTDKTKVGTAVTMSVTRASSSGLSKLKSKTKTKLKFAPKHAKSAKKPAKKSVKKTKPKKK